MDLLIIPYPIIEESMEPSDIGKLAFTCTPFHAVGGNCLYQEGSIAGLVPGPAQISISSVLIIPTPGYNVTGSPSPTRIDAFTGL